MREELLELLEKAQSGDKVAEERFIIIIRDNIMRRRIGRYLHKNRQCQDDDLMQEFLIGVASAIHKAEMDIGDPIEFIIQQGVYRTRTYLRRHIIHGTTQVCMDCGNESRLNRVGNNYICKKCGSHNVVTREIDNHDETLFQTMEANSNDIDEMIEEVAITSLTDRFEQTLDKNTNVYRLYEIMVKQGINRDNPEVKNYIKTISIMWGGCSQQNVLQNLNKLQVKFLKFLADNNIEIINGRLVEKNGY